MPVPLSANDQSKCRIHLGYSYGIKTAYPGEWNQLTIAMEQIEDTLTRDRIAKQIALCESALEDTEPNAGKLTTEQLESDGETTTTLQQRASYQSRLRFYNVTTDRLARMLGVRKFH
jgi:hypothetical protein